MKTRRETEMDFAKALQIVTGEVSGGLNTMDPNEVEALADAIVRAGEIIVTGQGRSGLVARAFAMRLSHLGLPVHVVGESTTPPIGKGHLLVAVSCSGTTEITCHIAKKARSAGAATACLTGKRRSRLSRMSGLTVLVDAPPKAERRSESRSERSRQFGSTLFEQCALIVLDALCFLLMERLKQSHTKMLSRHANLE